MRALVGAWVLASALILLSASPGETRGHAGGAHGGGGHHAFGHHEFRGRGTIVIGPRFWWGLPYPYYALPYYPPPPIVEEPPPVYVEPAPPGAYWYYCASARAYYPTVATCPEPWIPVAPSQ